jgi:hypothetical protein
MMGHIAARDSICRGLLPFEGRRKRRGNECMPKCGLLEVQRRAVYGGPFTEALLPVLGTSSLASSFLSR